MKSVLLIEDRQGLRRVYAQFLRKEGYGVKETGSVEEARKAMETHRFSLILSDYMLPGVNGLDFLKELQEIEIPVIIMTAFGEVKLAVEAMRAGAFDFLEKPVDLDYLALVLKRALEHHSLEKNVAALEATQTERHQIVGRSAALRAAIELAEKVAPSDANCLLLGESGVGKEVFASFLHRKSLRGQGPMISINCASIPRDLIESELFGHEKGAFTGAVTRKTGLVEMAEEGSLFLDEIGELPLELQPKLLRVIQSREFFRVGGNRPLKSNIRLICATNRDLKEGIRQGWFREDLYYRLAVFPVEIPPLRQRKEDLLDLVPWFLAKFRHPHPKLDAKLMQLLTGYNWPGNVRELENVLERAVILSQGATRKADHFPNDIYEELEKAPVKFQIDLGQSFKVNLARAESELEIGFIEALAAEGLTREEMAKRLGVSVKTLYNKMKRHGL